MALLEVKIKSNLDKSIAYVKLWFLLAPKTALMLPKLQNKHWHPSRCLMDTITAVWSCARAYLWMFPQLILHASGLVSLVYLHPESSVHPWKHKFKNVPPITANARQNSQWKNQLNRNVVDEACTMLYLVLIAMLVLIMVLTFLSRSEQGICSSWLGCLYMRFRLMKTCLHVVHLHYIPLCWTASAWICCICCSEQSRIVTLTFI